MQMPQQGQTRATPILRLTACCNMRQTTCCAFAQGCAAGGAARTKDGGRRMSYRHRHPYPFQTFRHEIHLECRGCRVRWFGFSRHLHTFVADRTKDVAPCMQIQFGWLVSNYSGSGFWNWDLASGIRIHILSLAFGYPSLRNNKTLVWCPLRCFFIAVTWTAIGNELMRLWLWLRILRLSRGNSNKCHSLADSPDSRELPPIFPF